MVIAVKKLFKLQCCILIDHLITHGPYLNLVQNANERF